MFECAIGRWTCNIDLQPNRDELYGNCTTRHPDIYQPISNFFIRSFLFAMAMNELFHIVNLLIFFRSISGFNLDIEKAIVYQGTQGSYYGATTEMVSNPQGKWVLVGAPRQNYSGISKPGAIYQCPVTTTTTTGSGCTMLNIRANASPFPAIQAEENQGLGVNMLITDQNLVACAPMWKEAVTNDVYYAYGKCSDIPLNGLSPNNNKFFNLPINLRQTGSKIFYLAAEFGFSSARRVGQNRVVMGTPVVYDSTGGYILYQEGNIANFWQRFNIEEGGTPDNLKSTFRPGAYLGYAVGDGFFGQPSSSLVAMGAPGFSNNEGTIGAMGLFQAEGSNMRLRKMITGKTLGSGFGQSMVVADFNKDGRDDIAVGAPMEGEDSMNNLDVGAVYIYYGTGQSTYIDEGQRLRGAGAVMARFGFSVACPGDLNKDGFNDLIVGAPYEDNNKGAIYVFNGGSPKMAAMYSQRILASNINSNLRGFGFSLSKSNIDIDANTFVDSSVGSLLSSQAVVLRTRSIVSIGGFQTLNPTIMPLNSSGLACRGNSSSFNPCTTVQVCFNYSGDGLSNGIYIDYLLTSDPDTADLTARRFTFYENNITLGSIVNKTEVFIASGSSVCASYQARVAIADRKFFLRVNDKPRFDLTYKISSKFIGSEVRPILDQNKASETTMSTGQFLTECQPSCKPDLQIAGRALTTLVQVGKTQEVEIQILVVNLGDPAYGASFVLNSSFGIPFTGYTVLLEQGSDQMTCVAEGNGVRCTFDKSPLFSQVRGLVNVRFDVSAVKLTEGRGLKNLPAQIDIVGVAEVGSDVDTSNNMEVMKINLQLQATIQMIGSSSPDQVTISEAGNGLLILNQAYSIINIGPSPLPAVKVVYTVPVMYNSKIIIAETDLQLTSLSPSTTCNMTYFPSTGAVTSSPPIVNPSVIITPQSSVPLGCGVSGVACASYECVISEFALDDLQPFILKGNISEESLPEVPPGYTQIRYYTTATVYPAESLQIPINLNSNISYSAELPIFPATIQQPPTPLNLVPLIVGLVVGVLVMVLLGVVLWKLGFFRRKKREELNAFKRKSYAMQRQSKAAIRASRDLDAGDRQILSQYAQNN